MKFSANLSLLYTEVPFLERFALAAKDGFDAVEVQFPYDTPIQAIQQQLTEHQLKCVLINVPAGDLMQGGEGLAAVPARSGEFSAALVECLAYARALKVECVNVLAGRCFDENKKVFYLDTFYKNLKKTAEALAPFGIITTFEAINTRDMPGFLISTTEQMLTTLEKVNHPNVKMQIDIYHMALMRQRLSGFFQENVEKIGHVQFADIPFRGEPGTGKLDFPVIFKTIASSGYRGWVGAEYKPSQTTSDTLTWFETFKKANAVY